MVVPNDGSVMACSRYGPGNILHGVGLKIVRDQFKTYILSGGVDTCGIGLIRTQLLVLLAIGIDNIVNVFSFAIRKKNEHKT